MPLLQLDFEFAERRAYLVKTKITLL